MSPETLENNFTYHPPKNDQQRRYELLREQGKELAVTIVQFCPDSREREQAIQNLEQAVMWANAAIARNE